MQYLLNPALLTIDQRQRMTQQFMHSFATSVALDIEARWAFLIAAHIVGQHDFSLHWRNHLAMLRFAFTSKDYREAIGQLFRLILVPFGHLLGTLPTGNIGRATVSAFAPMALDTRIERLIAQAAINPPHLHK